MVTWLKSAQCSFVRSNKISPFDLVPACSRRSFVLNLVAKRDQQARAIGAQTNVKLFISRRLVISAVVLAGGAIAVWNLRKQHVALHADTKQAQGRTGSGTLAFGGTLIVAIAFRRNGTIRCHQLTRRRY